MAGFILRGGYITRDSQKRALAEHNKNIQTVLALTQDIEAVASQMGQERGASERKLTREDGDFLLKHLQRAFNNVKGLKPKRLNHSVVESKPKQEVKSFKPKEQKKEVEGSKTLHEKLNLNTNRTVQPKAEPSEKKVNIGFVAKVKATLANRKLSKEYTKFLKRERKKNKKLAKSKTYSASK